MIDYPIVPGLVVDFSASIDGTWQDMNKVVDINLWTKTGGEHGYED